MRTRLVMLALALTFAIAAAAAGSPDLGNRPPLKAAPSPVTAPAGDAAGLRQGGDTIMNATPIVAWPFHDTGTTAGFTDDYDETCPYPGSNSPDVVYSYQAQTDMVVCLDLCGSSYDTKLYVYDDGLNLVACNDDYYTGEPCGAYTSRLEAAFAAGRTYYIVVDGYGGESGAYEFANCYVVPPCVLACPPDGVPEGEPDLVEGYVDVYNGGCNTPGFPFQRLTSDMSGCRRFCGESGWYDDEGVTYRDTDWLIVYMGPSGAIDVTVDAEVATYFFEIGPQDCSSVSMLQAVTAGPCAEASLTITGYEFTAPVWCWVGPTVYTPPPGQGTYDYVCWFCGLMPDVVGTEASTWGALKALYDRPRAGE